MGRRPQHERCCLPNSSDSLPRLRSLGTCWIYRQPGPCKSPAPARFWSGRLHSAGEPTSPGSVRGSIRCCFKLLASPGPPASGPAAAAAAAGATRRPTPAALPAPAPPLRRCIPLQAPPSVSITAYAPCSSMEPATPLIVVVMGVMGCGKRCAGQLCMAQRRLVGRRHLLQTSWCICESMVQALYGWLGWHGARTAACPPYRPSTDPPPTALVPASARWRPCWRMRLGRPFTRATASTRPPISQRCRCRLADSG